MNESNVMILIYDMTGHINVVWLFKLDINLK